MNRVVIHGLVVGNDVPDYLAQLYEFLGRSVNIFQNNELVRVDDFTDLFGGEVVQVFGIKAGNLGTESLTFHIERHVLSSPGFPCSWVAAHKKTSGHSTDS